MLGALAFKAAASESRGGTLLSRGTEAWVTDASMRAQVICWVLGEYGTVSGVTAGTIMGQICAVEDKQTVDDGVRGYMLLALAKLSTHSGVALPPSAEDMLHSATHSRNVNLQQRALEVEALLRY